MLLRELFGDNARIKILEELISNWDFFLSVDELSRMSDVSKKSVYIHIDELNKIGLLVVEGSGSKKFKLNPKDKRAILLALIESEEYLRKLNEFENELDNQEAEFLPLSLSDSDDKNLLKVNSKKINSAIKSIPMMNFIM
ncbi:winged helix-turn-helix domain-containing protein [uncultured Methanobrevibacter sp.]|jgi:DNA-binding transcriptional ArsR family regulator|uniref:winged helix-turn-helix domain-containing protein n=1 Tax=uncultured Methanobrevibacter sp. TaxID=253161 RepID=UPI0025EA6E51|nr:winged helix-turn-helix domain-containing protein [uncultured Methanobrevibacter sp.]